MFGKKYTTIVEIEGMKCEHCAGHVKDALMELDGVKKVQVDITKKCATITSTKELEEASLRDKIVEAGYSFLSKKSV